MRPPCARICSVYENCLEFMVVSKAFLQPLLNTFICKDTCSYLQVQLDSQTLVANETCNQFRLCLRCNSSLPSDSSA